MSAPRVRVTIDRLVLRGVPAGQEAVFVTALESRLAVLAADAATLRGAIGTSIPVARPRLPRRPARSVRELGERTAAAVWTSAGGRP